VGVGYGANQDKIIALSLKKFEALKPLYRQQKHRSDSLEAANGGLHRTIAFQKAALRDADGIIVRKEALYQDADGKARVWQAKAKSRFWLIVGETALIVGGLFVAIGR
jgi:hypothetical protein